MLMVRVLGPLEIVVDDGPVTISALKERTLVALLASQGGRHVRLEKIVEELWADRAPANANASVHVLLSRVRRQLGSAGSRLLTVPGGYALAVEDGELDERIFLDALDRGRELIGRDQHVEAVGVLREGLGLWRGDPYADCSCRTTEVEAARLRGARVNALEALFEAELATGHHAGILTELDHVIADNPFHEHFWGMRMVALYRCGRQAEALRSYRELRQLTRSELGFDPTPELQRLELALLEHDASLSWAGPGLERVTGVLDGMTSGRPDVPAALLRIPVQPRVTDAAARPLVGRVSELAALAGCRERSGWQGLRAGLVSGEPGVGKTWLVMHEALQAAEAGASVVVGRCDEHAVGPYQPVAEIVAWALDNLTPRQLEASLAPATLSQLHRLALPSSAGTPSMPANDASPIELYEAVAALFRVLCATGELVLVLEDLHWVDSAAADMLRYLARRLEAEPLVLYCTYRPLEAARNPALPDLVHTVRRAAQLREVQLSALDDDEVNELVTTVIGRPISAPAATALQEQTGGNPLFVVELLRHLVDSGALSRASSTADVDIRDEAAAIRDALPPQSVRETVERRILRLQSDAANALCVGAVAGRQFDSALVAGITGVTPADAVLRLQECEESGLIESIRDLPGHYTFAHAVIRRSVYDRIPLAERITLHAEIAAALEATGSGTVAEIARHYYEASAGGPPGKAIEAGIRAALESRRAFAFDAAVDILERTRRLADSRATLRERVEVLLALGDAYWWAGQVERAEQLCAEAIQVVEVENLGHEELFARAVLGRWRNNGAGTQGFSVSEPDLELIEMIEAALAGLTGRSTLEDVLEISSGGTALEAALLGRLGIASYWSVPADRRRAIAERAVTVARASGNESVLLDVLVDRQLTLWSPGAEEVQLAGSAEVMTLARKLGQTARLADAHTYQFVDHLALGDVRAADVNLRDFLRAAATLRQPFYRWHARLLPALRALMEGRFDEAEALASSAVDEGEQGAETAELIVGLQMLWLCYERGQLAEIAPMLDLVAGTFGEIPAMEGARTWIAAEVGDHEAAAALLARFVEEDFTGFRADVTWLATMCMLASAAATVRDERAARRLLEILRPFSGRNVLVWVGFCSGPVDHVLGRLCATLGELEEAAAYLDDAAEMTHAMRARPLHLRIKLDRCLVSLAAGQPAERVAAYLKSIVADASALGMEGVRAQASALLEDLGRELSQSG